MIDILAEFFDQFNPEEQAFIRTKEVEARIILLQGQSGIAEQLRSGCDSEWMLQLQDSGRALAAATEFVGYQRVLAHRIDPVCTESVEPYLRQLGRVCEGLLAKHGGECKDALAEMLLEAERLAWLSLGRQLGSAKVSKTTTAQQATAQRACAEEGPAVNETTDEPASVRGAFVSPILTAKGWSLLEWATESGVDFHTANDYLKGVTKPYPSTRKKLADSLGVKVEDLPK